MHAHIMNIVQVRLYCTFKKKQLHYTLNLMVHIIRPQCYLGLNHQVPEFYVAGKHV